MIRKFKKFSGFKKLKKFELFDTEDLKINLEIPYLKGELKVDKLTDISQLDKAMYLLDFLVLKFPFFVECLNDKNPFSNIGATNEGHIVFSFTNDKWYIALGIKKMENNKFSIYFVRRGIDLTNFDNESIIMLGSPSPDYNPDKLFFEMYSNLSSKEVYEKIQRSFITTMKETGFYTLLNLGKKSPLDLAIN